MTTKDYVCEGDTCPECGDYKITIESYDPLYLHCENCGARWNGRGNRVPLLNANTVY